MVKLRKAPVNEAQLWERGGIQNDSLITGALYETSTSQYLHVLSIEHDISWLHIAVHNSPGVHKIKRLKYNVNERKTIASNVDEFLRKVVGRGNASFPSRLYRRTTASIRRFPRIP